MPTTLPSQRSLSCTRLPPSTRVPTPEPSYTTPPAYLPLRSPIDEFNLPLLVRHKHQDPIVPRRRNALPRGEPDIVPADHGREGSFDHIHGKESSGAGVCAVAEF